MRPGGLAGGKRKRRRLGRRVRNWLAAAVGPPLIHVWARSLRYRWLGDIHLENGMPAAPTNGIFVFWHQRMFAFAGFFRNSGARVMISEHGDGEMIARIVARLGIKPVRGSSTRGGARAVLELLREKDAGVNIVITPDGPRGPRHAFHEGAVYLASRTGLPIYPLTIAFKKYAQLPTWDGFIVPAPFTRALVRLGEAHRVPPDIDREGMEAARLRIEESLRTLTDTADREFADLYRQAVSARGLPGA